MTKPEGETPQEIAAHQETRAEAIKTAHEQGAVWAIDYEDRAQPDVDFQGHVTYKKLTWHEDDDPPLPGEIKGLTPREPRLEFPERLIEKAREEMVKEFNSKEYRQFRDAHPEIHEAAQILKEGLEGSFADWLILDGKIETLTDEKLTQFYNALEILMTKCKVQVAGTIDRKTAEELRADFAGAVDNAKQARLEPYGMVFRLLNEVGPTTLELFFRPNGQVPKHEDGNQEITMWVHDFVTGDQEFGFVESVPTLLKPEIYSEIVYLQEKIAAMIEENNTTDPDQIKAFIHFLQIRSGERSLFVTDASYPTSVLLNSQNVLDRLRIADLFRTFVQAKLTVACAEALHEATDLTYQVYNFDNTPGAKKEFMRRWNQSEADIPPDQRTRLDEKYKKYFVAMKKLLLSKNPRNEEWQIKEELFRSITGEES